MEFVISCITERRKLGKALSRLSDDIESLEQAMLSKVTRICDVDIIEFWMVDRPLDYIEVVKKTDKLIEIHCGVSDALSYLPADDSVFLENIKTGLDKVEVLLKS